MGNTAMPRYQNFDEGQIEELARFFHNIWHETQAPLQDTRKAKYRPILFFRNRVEQRAKTTLVALADNHIIGSVCWTNGSLNSLFVKVDFRGQGIGERLCQMAELEMALTGATHFELDCIFGNFAARRFYERQGWRVDREDVSIDETPEGEIETRHWMMVKP